ncbi:MAG: universal stress protein [Hyphomicrobiales bacterium]
MSPKNILINLNDVDNLDVFLKTACALAIRHQAHLIGVYVVPFFHLNIGIYDAEAAMQTLQQSELEHNKKIAKKAVEKFEKALKSQGVLGKARLVNSHNTDIAETFINQARTSDFIVIPVVEEDQNCSVEKGFDQQVVLGSGRPVILVPRGKVYEDIGDNVSVGWNLTSEAARAAFDVIPLLAQAANVRFVWVDAHLSPQESGNLPGAEIAEAFAHYGFNVTTEVITSDGGNIGKTLIHDAKVNGADLLVMGAYGHSRLHELIFGGATRYIFSHLSAPILMSR